MRDAYLLMLDQRNILTLSMFAFAFVSVLGGLFTHAVSARVKALHWLPGMYAGMVILSLVSMILIFGRST